MNNHQAAAPKRSGRHLRRRSWIRARLAGFGAALLLAGSVAGFGAAKLQQAHAMNNPLASCGGTVRILNTYLEAIDGHLADVAVEDFGADASHLQGWAAINEVFDQTSCSPQRVVDSLPWTQLSPATAEMLAHKVVGWSQNADIPNLPPRAAELKTSLDDDTEHEPVSYADVVGEGRALVVYPGDCDCFDTFAKAAREATAGIQILVARVGRRSVELAAAGDWDLIDPATLEVDVPDTPAVAAFSGGHLVGWLYGEENLANPWLIAESLFHPLNPTSELVPAEYLHYYGTCDGSVAAGVVQNATDRPVRITVTTHPAVAFVENGEVLSRRVVHDLGVVEAWGYRTFRVPTGFDVYAPCIVEPQAVYDDGQTLGGDYNPGEVPEPHRFKLSDVIDVESLPQEVEPEGIYPSPVDVQPKTPPPPATDPADEGFEVEENLEPSSD